MYKGKILKFSDQYAIICSDTLHYQKIKLKPQMTVGQTIYYFDEDIIMPAETAQAQDRKWFSTSSFAFKFAPVLAVLLIAVMVFNHQQISPTPIATYGVVSIDINLSISLLINAEGTVEHAEGKNSDGEQILSALDLIDAPLQDAIEAIISTSESKGYLNQNHRIFIATTEASDEDVITDLVENILEDSQVDDPYTVYVAEVDYTSYEKAEEENVTIGHYLIETMTDVPQNQLFDENTLDQIILDDVTPIEKRETQEQKQEDKKEMQEQQKNDKEKEKNNNNKTNKKDKAD